MPFSRRSFLQTCAASAAASMIPASALSGSCARSGARPNVVVIYSDDLGYNDVGCYGGEIPTPSIDSLAQGGVRFTDFYSTAPVCTPARFSLLTGSYPGRSLHGLDGVIMPDSNAHLDPCEKTLGERFQRHGYATALFGKWHLGHGSDDHHPNRHGFDIFSGFLGGCIDYWRHSYGALGPDWYVNNEPAVEEGYATDLITNHAIDYIDDRSRDNEPFFMMLSYNAPHYGKTDPNDVPDNTLIVHSYAGNHNTLQAPAEYLARFSHIENMERRYYAAMVASMDDNIGRFLYRLNENGQRENTLVWFISDNGATTKYGGSNEPLRDEKASVYEGGVRVPAIASWPGTLPADKVNTATLATIDLAPTLAVLTGFSLEGGRPLDGIDVSKVLLSSETVERDLFWEYKNGQAFRRGPWKLCNSQLFNLENDRREQHDLSAQNPETMDELTQAFSDMRYAMGQYTTECRNCQPPGAGDLIESITPLGSALCYELATSGAGVALYTDRDYAFADSLPEEFSGLPMIRTANDDKYNTSAQAIRIEASRAVTVYVLTDSAGDGQARWMREFERMDTEIETSAPFRFQALRRTYQAGEFVCGGNMYEGNADAKNNYVVLLKENDDVGIAAGRRRAAISPVRLSIDMMRKNVCVQAHVSKNCPAEIISPAGKTIGRLRITNGTARWGYAHLPCGAYIIRVRVHNRWFSRRAYLQ